MNKYLMTAQRIISGSSSFEAVVRCEGLGYGWLVTSIEEVQKCPICNGTGLLQDAFPDEECNNCEGTGEVEE